MNYLNLITEMDDVNVDRNQTKAQNETTGPLFMIETPLTGLEKLNVLEFNQFLK